MSHIYNHCVGPIIIFVTIDRAGGNAHDTRGKVVNLATLDVKSMLVPNYSAGCGGKVLKLAKYAALRAPQLTMEQVVVDGNGAAM